MEASDRSRAWLVIAAGDDRVHAGNSGYDDQIDAYYSWNSNVQNARRLAVGDAIVLWDKKQLLGVSIIEQIEEGRGSALLHRCPNCGKTRIQRRSAGQWVCSKCAFVFDEPVVEEREVATYRARYDAAWTPLEGLLGATELRSLQDKPNSFNSMRELDWPRFSSALADRRAHGALARLTARSPDVHWRGAAGVTIEFPQGHGHALVRVRRGQQRFREHLLATQGEACAFTGGAPARVLEAGHLYSYAELGTHFEHGGLMLRRDVHRLFDDGTLSVEPATLRIDVAPALAVYPQYARLHDRLLTVSPRDEQVEWLAKHWEEHRAAGTT